MSLVRRGWLALSLGVTLAVFAGFGQSLPTLFEQQYLPHHLFTTAARLLARAMSLHALWSLPAALALVLLAPRFHALSPRNQARVRFSLALVLLVGALFVLHSTGYDLHAWHALTTSVARMSPVTLALGLPGLLLFLGAGVARLFHRRHPSPSAPRSWWVPGKARKIAASLCTVFSAIFFIIQLTAGLLTLLPSLTRTARPNVIFIMVDTLRADHVGCYGYPRNTTPSLDRFAAESTRFRTAIAQGSWTPWSVFSFLSSQYADVFQARTDCDTQYAGYAMLTEILKEQGYATGAVISNPLLQAFPEFTQGFDYFDTSSCTQDMDVPTSPRVTANALQLLSQLQRHPFFLFLVYADPHDPYLIHPGFSPENNPPRRAGVNTAPRTRGGRQYRKTELALIDAYDSEIAFTDHHIGELLDALRAKGLYDNSLIVFLSDHGEEFMEHGHLGHMTTLYDEVLAVPLVIKLPGQRQGRVVDGDFPLIDLAPSVLGILGCNDPAFGLLGTDAQFVTLQRCADRPIFSSTVDDLFSARGHGDKYIYNPVKAREEMYRLTFDPDERNDRAATERERLSYWRATLTNRPGQPPKLRQYGTSARPVYTRQQLEQMKALGYLQ